MHSLTRVHGTETVDVAQPDLPSITQGKAAASKVNLNLDDIQGDILIGMKKNKELFFFFGIANAKTFKQKQKNILPLVTTTTQLVNVTAQPTTALNIAFSHRGLLALKSSKLGDDTLGDLAFSAGQLASVIGATNVLGDLGTKNWVPQFVGTKIHGVILLASDTEENIDYELNRLRSTLGNSIKEIYSLKGAAGPGNQQGHEQILVGETGDTVTRPDWAKDGSFLVFRQLKQLVPEFNKFLADNPIRSPNLTAKEGSELLGARMVGRWKSGAPIFLTPLKDDPAFGADPHRNNDFTYAEPGQTVANSTDQSKYVNSEPWENILIPFAKMPVLCAHQKDAPRAALELSENQSSKHHVAEEGFHTGLRAEASSSKTKVKRGLAFVCYQSNIANGFEFLQRLWANNQNFVHGNVGFDPIIGANNGAQRIVNGLDPTNTSRPISLATGESPSLNASHQTNTKTYVDFVVSRGGEYFFSPSLSAIAHTLSV
ncbi:fungal peroxidase [Mycena crocata]|nr:fungal peroxidase [Mycena crocata]